MGLIPTGIFTKCQVGGGGGAMGGGGLVPNTIPTLGLELYLDTTLGMGGYAQGATVNPWFDQSGHGRDMAWDNINTQASTFRITDSSSTKQPTVKFAKPGADTRACSLFRGAIPNLLNVNGYTFLCWMKSHATPPTVFSSIWKHEVGSRPEIGYDDALSPDPGQVFLITTGGAGTVGGQYTVPVAQPIVLCVRWNPPINSTGLWEIWATVGNNFIPVLQQSGSPWNWNSALANNFTLGIFESISSFIPGYDIALAAVWSRNITNLEMLSAFLYCEQTFGLD